MKKIVLSTLAVAAFACTLSAASTTACIGCHGAAFEKAALGKSKVVKGWSADQVEKALKGYKDGSYGGAMKAVMKGQVARLSDADMKDLAKQISEMK